MYLSPERCEVFRSLRSLGLSKDLKDTQRQLCCFPDVRHAESIVIDKVLQEKIKALWVHSQQDISSKQEIKIIQKEIESEKEKRRVLKNERTGIKKIMQELKDSGLSGSRINGRRPTSSTPAPTADKPPHSDHDVASENPLLCNESGHLDVPSSMLFTPLQISIF